MAPLDSFGRYERRGWKHANSGVVRDRFVNDEAKCDSGGNRPQLLPENRDSKAQKADNNAHRYKVKDSPEAAQGFQW